ncbi:unnamed protein product [Rotaria sp. Silwood2]|nr:unnamed protein product [Rotaria sp. Silwood2]
MNESEQQRHVIKYMLDKLENYAHKSDLWRLIHASHLRRSLLHRSARVSKTYSISEDLVRQWVNQVFTDVDQYVTELYRFIYSQQSHDVILFFNNISKKNTAWHAIQIEHARHLFPTHEELNENDLLENYYKYVQEKLTPKHNASFANRKAKFSDNSFDLDLAYAQAESKAKQYLNNVIRNFHERKTPDLKIIDEMIKLGIADMKQMPSNEDFQKSNNFLGRVLIFHQIKEAYKNVLQNTSDDFTLLRFGKIFGHNALPSTQQFNKQFCYLLHMFLKSVVTLFTLLTTNSKDNMISIISKIACLCFFDYDSSIIKLNIDLFSPESNVDQWTWLLEQWHDVLRTMPMLLTQAGAFSRLVRTTFGIGLIHLGKCAEIMVTSGCLPMNAELMNEHIFYALQTGFYFGIAYAVVDCLQDEIHNLNHVPLHQFITVDNHNKDKPLTSTETIDKCLHIMEQLLSGKNFDRSQLPRTPFTSMLIESFDNLLILTDSNNTVYGSFNELALLLRSQRMDKKEMDQYYDDEQLYLGSVLKSHFTYTCTTYLGDMSSAREDSDRLWIMPFLGQLTDDCRDFNDDIKSKTVTPFTYYASLTRRKESFAHHLLNPFYTFLNLCSDIYLSSNRDSQTGAFLGRRIARTLRAVVVTGDETSFLQFLNIFCMDNRFLYDYCWNKLRKQFPLVTDPEKTFFRALDASSMKYARTNRKLETYVCENLMKIENALNILPLHSQGEIIFEEELLISAMNYSVKVGGKRLRPLLMLMVADLYNIEATRILPLICGIEYLHTSSLIFDDLPAQDNSDLRRGQPSLHKTIINNDIPYNLCEGRAQLAAVDLISISMGLINNGLIKNGFSTLAVNRVVSEISMLMHDLCIGQMMDLRAARVGIEQENRVLDKIDRIAWFKTGKTIEVVMITPVILAKPPSDEQTIELSRIRELSRLMGILFQMRDDLLDVEGSDAIGKPTSLDIKNNTVTYRSVLGVDGTRQRLQKFLTQTLQLVDECWPTGSETIKDVIKYIVNRKT